MRQAGKLTDAEQAQRLADYLLTQGILARVDPDGDGWAIWIRDEDQMPQAVRELEEFQADPNGAKYRQAGQAAQSLRQQQARDDKRRGKNFIEMRDRWDRRPSGRAPLTLTLMAASILVSLGTNFGEDRGSSLMQAMMFQPLPTNFFEQFSWTPTQRIEQGEVWRLVTPIFIHFSILHLLFNMYMLYQFGMLIEVRRGSWRLATLVVVIAVLSNYGQSYLSIKVSGESGPASIMFGGMSGVVYGLFGYMWMKSRFEPQLHLFVSQDLVVMSILWFALCWFGVVGSVANWAHTVSLVVGATIGYAPTAWRKIVRT